MIGRRWQQGLATGLLTHAVTTLCALCSALPLAGSVSTAPSAADSRPVAVLVVLLRLGSSAAAAPGRYGALPLAAMLISAPLLLLMWLHASQTSAGLLVHANAAAAQYPRALAVWASCVAYLLALLLAAAALGCGIYRVLEPIDDARAQSLAALCAAAPFTLALVHPVCLLDTAAATLARGAPSARAALRGGLALIDRRLLLTRSAFGLASLALLGLGLCAPRALFGWSSAGSFATLCVGQLCALASGALRGLWLALLVERSHPRQEPYATWI
jgi:hypothetical protein